MRSRLLKSFALFALLATVFVSCSKDDDENSNDNSDSNVVDLGLPSGVKWATCNLGATAPCDYGNYYAWGETQTKDDYSWETYKHCNGSAETLTKYCYDAEYGNNGFTDNLTTLESADDAATAVLGSDYSMPNVDDWSELSSQCYWVWTLNYNNQGVSGYIVYKAKSAGDKGEKVYAEGTPSASYSLKDAHIFLPVAGFRINKNINSDGSIGRYWSASLSEGKPSDTRYCSFYGRKVYPTSDYNRYCGLSVRPVQRK